VQQHDGAWPPGHGVILKVGPKLMAGRLCMGRGAGRVWTSFVRLGPLQRTRWVVAAQPWQGDVRAILAQQQFTYTEWGSVAEQGAGVCRRRYAKTTSA